MSTAKAAPKPQMRTTLLRSLVFAGAVVAVALAMDLLIAFFLQGCPVPGRGRQFFMFRTALHGATFAFTAVGAAMGFAFVRCYSMTYARIVLLGAVSGMFALAAVQMAIQTGSFWGITVWLILGSALVSYLGGKLLGSGEARV